MLLSENYNERYSIRAEKIIDHLLHWQLDDEDDEILEEECHVDMLISRIEDYFSTMQEKEATFYVNNDFRTQFSEVANNFITLWYYDPSEKVSKVIMEIVIYEIEVRISELIEQNFGDLFLNEYDEEANFFEDVYTVYSAPCAETIWEECGNCIFSSEVSNLIDDTIIKRSESFIEVINLACEKVLELLQCAISDYINVTLYSILEEVIQQLQGSMLTDDPVWKKVGNKVNIVLDSDAEYICNRICYEIDDALTYSYIEAATALYAQHLRNMYDKEVNKVAEEVKAMEI